MPRPARETLSDVDDAQREPAELVNEIASELNLLSLSWTNPDAFLERRDFLSKRLRRLAKRLGAETPRRSPPATHRPAAIAIAPSVRSPEPRARSARPILTLNGMRS
ncbi:MAG: hypothetical protein ACYDD1_13625 [Caulobacteraceae bacterium]